MREVGDYSWHQLSTWDYAPDKCIEKFVGSENGKHSFHFFLQRITEIISENHWKVETVKSLEGVPEKVLNWRNDNHKVRDIK